MLFGKKTRKMKILYRFTLLMVSMFLMSVPTKTGLLDSSLTISNSTKISTRILNGDLKFPKAVDTYSQKLLRFNQDLEIKRSNRVKRNSKGNFLKIKTKDQTIRKELEIYIIR